MRKLFTLLVGLLLTTAFTANAVDVTVYVCTWDDTKGDYEDVAQSFTTYLTKSDDGVFTLQDVTNTGVPLSFKFTDPKINSYSRLTFTGSNLYRAPNYNNYPYLLDAEGKYAVCEYRDPDSSEAFEVYYPLVSQYKYSSWIEKYDLADSEYQYWAYINISGYLEDDSDFDAYLMFAFNDPSEENQAAYDEVAAQISALETSYNDAVEAIKSVNPNADLEEMQQLIEGKIEEEKTNAAKALAMANEDLQTMYPMYPEELENMIAEMKSENLEAYNKGAYDMVLAKVNTLKEEYNDAVEEIEEVNPDFDFTEWKEMILDDSYSGLNNLPSRAEQAFNAANDENEIFNFPFTGEDVESQIIEMKKAGFKDYNEAEYAKVVATLNDLQEKYDDTVDQIKEVNPDFNFTEWTEIQSMITEAEGYAEKAFNGANEYGEKFTYAYTGEDVQAFISEMGKAGFADYNQKAYAAVVATLNELQEKYDDTVEQIKEVNPDFDFTEWTEIQTMITDAKGSADTEFTNANEFGDKFNFAYTGEDVQAFISEMGKAGFEDYNKAEYAKVVATLNALQEKYDDTVDQIKEVNPDFDFTEWTEIQSLITEAEGYAEKAFNGANEYGEKFTYAYTGDDVQAFISEMGKAGFADYNQKAYDNVVAEIDEAETEYNDAIALIKEVNPTFDLTEWSQIISEPIKDAKTGAAQALASATEDGVEFNFAFSAEDTRNSIAEMNKEALADPNQKAYKEALAKINNIISDYYDALDEIEEINPDFKSEEWDAIILEPLETMKDAAAQALATADEDGVYFKKIFAFEDDEYYEGMIAEMKSLAGVSGIENIEAEVAAGKAKIFTLDGKSHNAPVKGQVNVIVRGNTTIKTMINK